MLILSRKAGQTIQIGDDIEVTVSSVQDGQVRLAICAPTHVAVDRSEIRAAKAANPRTKVAAHASR